MRLLKEKMTKISNKVDTLQGLIAIQRDSKAYFSK